MNLSLFRDVQKTEKQITPIHPPCFNQATGQNDKLLSYEKGPQAFRNTNL